MEHLKKYPRTYHLPWSPGVGSDDKVARDIGSWQGRRVVITEKMDGENTTMYNDHMHARSLDSRNHDSRNLVKGIWGRVRFDIPEGWRVCGENMFARHSIEYNDLESYFLVFSIWSENNICLSWEETVEYSIILGLTPVRVLWEGEFDLKFVQEFHAKLDLSRQEGFVVRSAGAFHYDKFKDSVVKWVRKGHVQTDQHWMQSKIVPNKLKSTHEKIHEGGHPGDSPETIETG